MILSTPVKAVSVRAIVAAVAAGLGVSFVLDRGIGLLIAFLIGLLMVGAVRQGLMMWDVFLTAFAGALILGLGFANVGLWVAGVPVPLSALLLGLLLAVAIGSKPEGLWSLSTVLVISFVILAVIHLLFEYPRYGVLALRDVTLPVETAWLLVGYWTVHRFGRTPWIKGLRWVFLALLAYLAMQPWYGVLVEHGPVVGLQRPVPLFGDLSASGTAAAAALLFFALIRPFGALSYLVAAAFIPFLLLAQYRGLYLAIPASFLLTWLLVGRRRRSRVGRGLAATVAVGSLAVAFVFPFAPQGRLGPVTPGFLASQIATLTGEAGPGASGVDHRLEWLDEVTEKVMDRPWGWLTGLGLGPDLVEGFRISLDGPLVRKPHNDYLEVFARLGVPGLFLLVSILAVVLLRLLRGLKRVDELDGRFLSWVLAISIVYLLIAATQPLLSYPFGTIPLFAALGAGLAVARGPKE